MDSDTAQTHLWPIKDVLDVLEQLPDVVLVWVPVREGVRGVQETREWTDQWVEGRVLEDDLLERENCCNEDIIGASSHSLELLMGHPERCAGVKHGI